MDESATKEVVEIFVAIVITGLGAKEIFARWQEWHLKRSDKQLEHDISKEDKGIEWIIEQAEHYRLQTELLQRESKEQLEKLQKEKFSLIQDDLRSVIESLSPCRAILEELLESRKYSATLNSEIKSAVQKHNEDLQFIISRMGARNRKMDSTGNLASALDNFGEIESRQSKIQTGSWSTHPPPPDESQ